MFFKCKLGLLMWQAMWLLKNLDGETPCHFLTLSAAYCIDLTLEGIGKLD